MIRNSKRRLQLIQAREKNRFERRRGFICSSLGQCAILCDPARNIPPPRNFMFVTRVSAAKFGNQRSQGSRKKITRRKEGIAHFRPVCMRSEPRVQARPRQRIPEIAARKSVAGLLAIRVSFVSLLNTPSIAIFFSVLSTPVVR